MVRSLSKYARTQRLRASFPETGARLFPFETKVNQVRRLWEDSDHGMKDSARKPEATFGRWPLLRLMNNDFAPHTGQSSQLLFLTPTTEMVSFFQQLTSVSM